MDQIRQEPLKEALFYHEEMIEDRMILVCDLCPHRCKLKEGQTGLCHVRKHDNGKLVSLSYGQVSGIGFDPIEKKPIAMWKMGTQTLSFGSFGCNMRCEFCQNHDLSFNRPKTFTMSPFEVIALTKTHHLPTIAYTYNEPTTFYEMMYETAVLAREEGLYNVVVTNGVIETAPFLQLLPYIDAMNIDIKTFNDENYKKLGGISVKQVLDIVEMGSKQCHVEVTCLIVPGISDDIKAFEAMLKALVQRAPHIVLHITRYFPRHAYHEEPTDFRLMTEFQTVALKYFKHVFLGNVR